MSDIKRGDRFTHLSILDPGWKPVEGQTYRDAPKAQMVVTSVTTSAVYFTFAGAEKRPSYAALSLDRNVFEARYAVPRTSTCRHCGAEIEHDPNIGWFDVVSGDDGGTYDLCPRGIDMPHEPTKKG